MNVGAGDAAVLKIAEDGDIEVVDFSEAVADSERVEKTLRGMFVRAVAGVDDGNVEMACDEIGSTGGCVTHDQAIGLHGVERLHGVEERLAFFHAGGFRLEIHRVGAEARGGGAEADARARGVLEERQSDSFAAESSEFFERIALNGLKRPALIEEKSEFVRGERFKRQEIAEAKRHICTL
jgi:hypothetical protein